MTFLPPFGTKTTGIASDPVAAWYLPSGVDADHCIAAYQPKGADDLADSYINLANPGTYDAAAGTAPTWDATNGWKFSNAQYLVTGLVPTLDGTWSMFMQFADQGSADWTQYFGVDVGTPDGSFCLFVETTGTGAIYCKNGNSSANSTNTPEFLSGNYGIAGKHCYRDGVVETGHIGAGTGTASVDIYINGVNNGISAFRAKIYIQAMAIYDISLDGTQAAELAASMAAL